jgi:poly(A) polymerase
MLDERAQRRAIYRLGGESFRDLVLLAWAGGAITDGQAMLDRAAAWTAPKFPLHGADVLALGIASGPNVGALLKQVEAWWEAGDFRASRAACREELARIAKIKPKPRSPAKAKAAATKKPTAKTATTRKKPARPRRK